jgi:RNA polymerase sigma-70 factor, ECF subfamily
VPDSGTSSTFGWPDLFEQARTAWPDLGVARERFFAHLQFLGVTDAAACPHPGDLLLALACLEEDERALATFETQFLEPCRPVVARVRPAPDFVDEVLQELRTKLLVGDQKALGGYAGRGPLLAWVRIAASRAAIDAVRALGAAPPAIDVTDNIADQDLGPELALLMETNRRAFQEAVAAAFATLAPQERNLLRRHLVDHMTLEEIAAPYGVHPATITRRLAAIRDRIAADVRERLSGVFGNLDPDQLQSVFRAIRSHVYVSLSPLLQRTDPPPNDSE